MGEDPLAILLRVLLRKKVLRYATLYRPDLYSSLAVPIYDGRPKNGKGFSFMDIDFQQLSGLPLYKKGRANLPPNSLVAVGYTLSTYLGNQSGMTILSSNIQFIILLGIAA
jgi:hypothetical protein